MAEVILTAPGPTTWIVPAGVTSIQVECCGGGAARSGRNNNGVNAAGSANGGSGASTPHCRQFA